MEVRKLGEVRADVANLARAKLASPLVFSEAGTRVVTTAPCRLRGLCVVSGPTGVIVSVYDQASHVVLQDRELVMRVMVPADSSYVTPEICVDCFTAVTVQASHACTVVVYYEPWG
jgi:hypothetical protein